MPIVAGATKKYICDQCSDSPPGSLTNHDPPGQKDRPSPPRQPIKHDIRKISAVSEYAAWPVSPVEFSRARGYVVMDKNSWVIQHPKTVSLCLKTKVQPIHTGIIKIQKRVKFKRS
jgi:hypothetical protein